MRIHRGWLVSGTVGAGILLATWGQRGWTQPGELPGLRPPTLPPVSALSTDKDPIPLPIGLPPAPPPIKVTPPPAALLADQLAPAPAKLPTDVAPPAPMKFPDAVDLFPPSKNDAALPATTLAQAVVPGTADSKLAGRQEPNVSVEWVGPNVVRLNHPMTCEILVRNQGPATVHNVTVRHHLKPGVTCKKSEPLAATENNDLVWTVGTLAPGQQRRLELQLVASQRGPLDCQATVSFASIAGQQVQVREPLLLIKMRMPEKTIVGDSLNVMFAVANPGDGVTEQVKVKAMLPEGLDSARGRIVELDVGNLNPKETRTLQIPCVAKVAGIHKCSLVASADGNLTASDHGTTDILQARLDVVLNGPKLRYLDRHALYQIKVSNPGNAQAQNVVLNEVVPAGFRFHSATSGGRWDEGTKTVSWQLGDLMPGQSREVAVNLIAAATGDHRLQANVASTRGARTETAAVTRVEGSSSLVIELVDVDDPVEVGGETSYEIRVTNAGTKTESNLELTCTLPDQVEFKSAKSIAGMRHRLEGRDVIFEPLARLAPKADVIYRVTVRGQQAGDVRFRTRIRADGMPEPVLREESTRFYNDNILPK